MKTNNNMNNRRSNGFDLGSNYNSGILWILECGFRKWKPAKMPMLYKNWFANRREYFDYDLCAWGMCIYAQLLRAHINYAKWAGEIGYWYYLKRLRRLRKKWRAIKHKK